MAQRSDGSVENPPGLRSVCIVGTRPGVGKTIVGGALACHFRRQGLRVGVFKPIATGCRSTRHGLRSIDAEFLAHWADSTNDLATINPVAYRRRLLVAECARHAGRPVDRSLIENARRQVDAQADVVLIEGVGSVVEPISPDRRFIDVLAEWKLPIILVSLAAGDELHATLASIDVARQAGLTVAAVVLNRYRPHEATPADETSPDCVARYGHVQHTVVVPWDRETSLKKCRLGTDVQFAVSQLGHLIAAGEAPGGRTPADRPRAGLGRPDRRRP